MNKGRGSILAICAALLGMRVGVAQSVLRITSPKVGAVIASGGSLTVTVNTGGLSLSALEVWSDVLPTGAGSSGGVSMNVPSTAVGPAQLIAVGVTTSGTIVYSPAITIDVEPSGTITALSAAPTTFSFNYPGGQGQIVVTATLADGSQFYMSRSSLISYGSSDPNVVSVGTRGLITAQAPGPATITVSNGSVSAMVSVSVLSSSVRGDLDGNGIVDKNDLNIILAALDTPATGPNDKRDLNHDGVVNALDARILVTLCTNANCEAP
jgi:dockerin type I repeat protein